jgi:hypothetical protein
LKIALIRGKTNQKNECQTGKKKQQKIWLNDEIESQKKSIKGIKTK